MHDIEPRARQPVLKILTLTSNDVGMSYGPAVHYLELWNEATALGDNVSITGMAPSWTGLPPVVVPMFSLQQYPVAVPVLRQFLWDLICAAKILFTRADVVYVRLASFHFASVCAIITRRKLVVGVEINGSAIHDAKSRNKTGLISRLAAISERVLIKRAHVVFSVTERLKLYASGVNPDAVHICVENGVSRRFFRVRKDADIRSSTRPLTGIYVGTFTAWDGACKIKPLATAFPGIEFLLIGDGGQKADVEADAPPNMKFLGWIGYERLPEFYAKSDFGIALYEDKRHQAIGSSSLKLREYIASELPIFTSRASGTEQISDLGIGYRSPDGNAIDFLSFLNSLELYRQSYSQIHEHLKAEISWAATARTTLDGIRNVTFRS